MASPPLFDFKAGRVEFDESSGKATPLAGQGRVTLIRSSEDPSLLGMQWLSRGSNINVPGGEELLLVPGDVEFSHVPHCQTGRVIQMRFNSSGERHLYWLQDAPKGDLHEWSSEDETIIQKLNELANSIDFDENDEEEDAMQDDEAGGSEAPESNTYNNPDVSTVSRETNSSNPEPHETPQSTLYSALAARLGSGQAQQREAQVPLSRLVTQSKRVDHIHQADEGDIAKLLEHTAGLANNREELREVVMSPHFAQCLDEVCHAAMISPAFAQELGLEKLPRSSEELIEELKKLKR